MALATISSLSESYTSGISLSDVISDGIKVDEEGDTIIEDYGQFKRRIKPEALADVKEEDSEDDDGDSEGSDEILEVIG